MENATKLILFASCFFKLLSIYNTPKYEPKRELGQKEDFNYNHKMRVYLQNKELFRCQMLNITKYIYESHMVVCKLILSKI